MQAQVQMPEIGDEYIHSQNGNIVEVTGFFFHPLNPAKSTITIKVVLPIQSPEFIEPLDFFLNTYIWHTRRIAVHPITPPMPYPSPLKAAAVQSGVAIQIAPNAGEIWAHKVHGDEFEIISVDYQRGRVTSKPLSSGWGGTPINTPIDDLLLNCDLKYKSKPPTPCTPPGESAEFFGLSMAGILRRCTCGVDTVGYGNHSDWCDKHEKEENK